MIIHPADDCFGEEIEEVVKLYSGRMARKKFLGMLAYEASFDELFNAECCKEVLEEMDEVSHVDWNEAE